MQVMNDTPHSCLLYQPLCCICQDGEKFGCQPEAEGEAGIYVVVPLPVYAQQGPVLRAYRDNAVCLLDFQVRKLSTLTHLQCPLDCEIRWVAERAEIHSYPIIHIATAGYLPCI